MTVYKMSQNVYEVGHWHNVFVSEVDDLINF